MKIAIDCRLFDKTKNTGISRYTEYIIDYYKSRLNSEDIVLVVNEKIHNIGLRQISTTLKPFSLIDFYIFPRFIKQLEVNVLHSPFYSGLSCSVSGVISILTVHDLMYKLVPDFFSKYYFVNLLGRFYYNIIVKKSILNSNELISVSETTSNDIKCFYDIPVNVIPEHSSILSAADDGILSKFNLKKNGYFFYCGNARRHKNLEFMKEIFSLNVQLPSLVIAGAKHLNVNNVISVGNVSDSELRSLYENSIAFVFPSRYEGFGLPILEALQAGTQVVASRISAFLEFNSEGIHYFSLGNKDEFISALHEAMTSPKRTDTSFFSHYSHENIYFKMDQLLNRLSFVLK